jgi:hypothetical protein
MSAVPGALPVMIPVAEPTLAIPVLLLVQLPPPPAVKVIVCPTHTLVAPTVIVGSGLIVMVTVR